MRKFQILAVLLCFVVLCPSLYAELPEDWPQSLDQFEEFEFSTAEITELLISIERSTTEGNTCGCDSHYSSSACKERRIAVCEGECVVKSKRGATRSYSCGGDICDDCMANPSVRFYVNVFGWELVTATCTETGTEIACTGPCLDPKTGLPAAGGGQCGYD